MKARSLALILGATGVLLALSVADASADEQTVTGANGQTLTISEAAGLPRKGSAEVTVTGSGFDETKGIYVAVCVIPAPGETPTPCLGGVDTSGGSGLSAWISSNPPSYGEGLAAPYDAGGSFELSMQVAGNDGVTNCLNSKVAPRGCAVVARADHTRTEDRSQDVLIPLTFDGPAATKAVMSDPPTTQAPAAVPSTTPAVADTSTAVPAGDADQMSRWQLVLVGGGIGLVICAAYVLGTRSRSSQP